MKKVCFLLTLIFFITTLTYGQNLRNKFKRELKRELKDFKNDDFVIEYPPINNFGAGTCYKDKANFASFEDDYWGIAKKIPPTDFQKWLILDSVARVASTCSSEKISSTVKTQYASSIILPQIFKLLKIKNNISGSRLVTSKVSFGSFYMRAIRKQPFQDLLDSLLRANPKSRIGTFFKQGNLVVTTADVVVENISYQIEVNSSLSDTLDARLKLPNPNFGGDSLNFKISKAGDKTYAIEIDKPVIVATLSQLQSGPGVLSINKNDKSQDLMDVLKTYKKPLNRKSR